MVPVNYVELNAPRKENYNFAKVSAILADCGYTTMRLSDDWQGADFLAHHYSGRALFVQLKSRLMVSRIYSFARTGKTIHICFPTGDRPRTWYMYAHDALLSYMPRTEAIGRVAWHSNAGRSRGAPGKRLLAYLDANGRCLGIEGMSLAH